MSGERDTAATGPQAARPEAQDGAETSDTARALKSGQGQDGSRPLQLGPQHAVPSHAGPPEADAEDSVPSDNAAQAVERGEPVPSSESDASHGETRTPTGALRDLPPEARFGPDETTREDAPPGDKARPLGAEDAQTQTDSPLPSETKAPPEPVSPEMRTGTIRDGGDAPAAGVGTARDEDTAARLDSAPADDAADTTLPPMAEARTVTAAPQNDGPAPRAPTPEDATSQDRTATARATPGDPWSLADATTAGPAAQASSPSDPWTFEGPTPEAESAPEPEPTLPPAAQETRPRPACTAALFGKLPARGDFIARNMPREVQRPFEDWLIPLIQQTRSTLGSEWTAHWRGAGPWRFWIGADVFGGSWQHDLRKGSREQATRAGALTGVLLPSADRHGRDFPLVLVLADSLARLMPPPVTASPDRGWYDLCDELLYGARAGTDIATVEAALDRLPGPLLPEGAEEMAQLLDQRALWAEGSEVRADGTSRIWDDIAAADHHLAASQRSYWWQAPHSGAAQRVLTLAGLPDAGSFAFMLSQGHPDTPPP